MKSTLLTWIGLVVFVCIAAVTGAAINSARGRNSEQQLAVQKKAIERAAVLCYSLEGFYPPQIKYLEEKYGLIVERDKFMVHYRTFGSNIRPEISVHRLFTGLETVVSDHEGTENE
jgi:hypothetical protein